MKPHEHMQVCAGVTPVAAADAKVPWGACALLTIEVHYFIQYIYVVYMEHR